MDLESTITLVGFAAFAVALLGYLAAMKRDLRSEIAALGTGLAERFDTKLDASMSLTASRFEAVDARFGTLESRMDTRFEALESRIDARFEALESRIDARFTTVDARIDGLDARVTDLRDDVRTGFAAVDARLVTLEQRTFDIGARRRPGAG
ncbi:hypothetical protein SAMN06295964_1639 [Aeromicrobium choanae]|uniref:Uncharacterized protein n=2 Tax=Aeromicrobium choanae TaxID=1736691 RepID=A0A1T4YZQ1_9ACTN|nr:hypothetical protein SAMN06295964_1639 [Aeromicrobium choanae]